MRWLVILLGAIVLLLGLLPLIENSGFLPMFLEFIPREPPVYNILIAIAGGIITYIGVKRL